MRVEKTVHITHPCLPSPRHRLSSRETPSTLGRASDMSARLYPGLEHPQVAAGVRLAPGNPGTRPAHRLTRDQQEAARGLQQRAHLRTPSHDPPGFLDGPTDEGLSLPNPVCIVGTGAYFFYSSDTNTRPRDHE